jgi:hypothetical protein
MKSNPSFYGRFSEKIEFPNWAPKDCLDLLIKECTTEAVDLPVSLYDLVKSKFKVLSEEYSGWGNAGDVLTIHDKMSASRLEFRIVLYLCITHASFFHLCEMDLCHLHKFRILYRYL